MGGEGVEDDGLPRGAVFADPQEGLHERYRVDALKAAVPCARLAALMTNPALSRTYRRTLMGGDSGCPADSPPPSAPTRLRRRRFQLKVASGRFDKPVLALLQHRLVHVAGEQVVGVAEQPSALIHLRLIEIEV
jgi:hypothetical protein